jgi:hypothetical protein
MHVLLRIWKILFLPWFFLAPLSLMTFDSGPSRQAYVIVVSLWTYPVTVGIAYLLRKKLPAMMLLPFLNFFGVLSIGL